MVDGKLVQEYVACRGELSRLQVERLDITQTLARLAVRARGLASKIATELDGGAVTYTTGRGDVRVLMGGHDYVRIEHEKGAAMKVVSMPLRSSREAKDE